LSNKKLFLVLGAIVVLGAGLLAVFAGRGLVGMDHSGEAAPFGGQSAPGVSQPPAPGEAVLVRPSGQGDGLPEDAADRFEGLPGVLAVDRYISGTLPDGTPLVGLDPVTAPLRGPDGEALSVRLAAGRSLEEESSATDPPALVGVDLAESRETIYGYPIAGMIASHSAPALLTEEVQVQVVDVVSTGDEQADRAVFVPGALAQQLLAGEQAASWLVVRLEPGADPDVVTQAAESAGLQIDQS
jgi:hypothetical protein